MTKKHDKTTENKQNDQLKQEEACEQNNWKERFIRASADLENYQRRIVKERAIWVEKAQADVFLDLLTIVDDFDRAMDHCAKGDSQEAAAMKTGFELIYKAFYKLLETYGIKEIVQAENFDPECHEAMTQIDSPKHESGAIVQTLQKGFMINDRVLRPAKVAVAK